MLVVLTVTSLALFSPKHTLAYSPGDTYPTPDRNATDCSSQYGPSSWCINGYDLSSRGFGYRNCTDFVAWKLSLTWSQFKFPVGKGDARDWEAYATNAGYQVTQTPSVGDIAWWGSLDHVAIVTVVHPGPTTTVDVEEYNQQYTGVYGTRQNITADAYLHKAGSTGTQTNPASYAGHIVQWNGDTKAQKTSWYVSSDLKRYWVPDISTYNCLTGNGHTNAGPISSDILNQLPDQTGQWATCGSDTLGTNRFLFRNTYLRSSNGQYSIYLQGSDGNLVLYGPKGALWANSRASDFLVMQADNNLVTYAYGRGATWASNTVGTGANALVVQNDGNLVLYGPKGAIWDRYHGRLH